jgi:hypothetical protein
MPLGSSKILAMTSKKAIVVIEDLEIFIVA